jgi:hypothetical protein
MMHWNINENNLLNGMIIIVNNGVENEITKIVAITTKNVRKYPENIRGSSSSIVYIS